MSGDDGGAKIKKKNRGTKLPDRRHTVFSWTKAIIDSISFRNCVRIAHILTQRSAPFSFCSNFCFCFASSWWFVYNELKWKKKKKMRRQRPPMNTTETDCRRRSSRKKYAKILKLILHAFAFKRISVRSASGVVSSLRLLCFPDLKKKSLNWRANAFTVHSIFDFIRWQK